MNTMKTRFISLFEDLTFTEYVKRVFKGLRSKEEIGLHKWAKYQLMKLWSFASAIIIPLIMIGILYLFSLNTNPNIIDTELRIIDPEEFKVEELKPIEPIKIPDPITKIEYNIENVEIKIDNPIPEKFSPNPSLRDSVLLVKSPIVMRGIYGTRDPGMIGTYLNRFGAPNGSEDAVMRALRWLKKHQNIDGSWNNVKPAMTGLALLTFLAHGETSSSEEFGETVRAGLEWLLDNQLDNGTFRNKDGHNYSQPIVAYALSEAFTMTRIPDIRYAAEKAIQVLIDGQNKSGGWTYNCIPSERNDTSYMGWCAQALKAAKIAKLNNQGLDEAIIKAKNGFRHNYLEKDGYGYFGYTSPQNSGLTGVGVLCLQLLGDYKSKEVINGLNSLEMATFIWDIEGKRGLVYNKSYYWYYITQAKFHAGGGIWENWNGIFAKTLIKNQTIIKDGIMGLDGKMVDIGYWDMDRELSGHTDGDVMNTCLSTLQLEVYYRQIPTYQEIKVDEDEITPDDDDLIINLVNI